MLYYLFRYLDQFGIPGASLWGYISFRAILTLVLSLIISIWFGEWFIKWMKKHNANEAQRDITIDPYGVEKKGVPTMGGLIIILATVVPVLLLGRLRNVYLLLMLLTTVWLGALGFIDDYIKMKVSKDGLRPIYNSLDKPYWVSPSAWCCGKARTPSFTRMCRKAPRRRSPSKANPRRAH